MKNFTYTRAISIKDAIQKSSAEENTQFIGGGTNLVDRLKAFLDQPAQIIDISRLQMQKIEKLANGSLRVGALVTNTALADHPEIRRRYPLLSRAILAGASQQIRNVATVGGNILQRTRCSYYYDPAFSCNKRVPGSGCPAATGINRMHAILGASDQCVAVNPSDMCVALAALDVVVEIEGAKGKRQIPFVDFHRLPANSPELDTNLQPGELITSIILPPLDVAKSGVYLKIRDRTSYSFALISVAAAIKLTGDKITDVRLAMGGVAHKPWRATAVEQFLIGKPGNTATYTAAANLALQGAKPLTHNSFKVELTKRAIRRALTVSAQGGGIV